MITNTIQFPEFQGIRCLMMPYIQGDPLSVPEEYRKGYEHILSANFFKKGDIGFLTIDESRVLANTPQRGDRAKFGRALHTEAGLRPNKIYAWGAPARPVPTWGAPARPVPTWGGRISVILDFDVEILLANSIDDSCAVWDATHQNTSIDGDIGDCAEQYPYSTATKMKAGEVHKIGILTPHESLAVSVDCNRQFLRIISSGVYGRESHFTKNPLMN